MFAVIHVFGGGLPEYEVHAFRDQVEWCLFLSLVTSCERRTERILHPGVLSGCSLVLEVVLQSLEFLQSSLLDGSVLVLFQLAVRVELS